MVNYTASRAAGKSSAIIDEVVREKVKDGPEPPEVVPKTLPVRRAYFHKAMAILLQECFQIVNFR
jgi:hypothetical protein